MHIQVYRNIQNHIFLTASPTLKTSILKVFRYGLDVVTAQDLGIQMENMSAFCLFYFKKVPHMPSLFISFNIKMDHLQLEFQESLLTKVTLVVPVLPFPFRKVTLEAVGRQ